MTELRPKRGFMIAAPSSGSGKTVITLALLRALRNTGLNVSGAKAGPDFIDPKFHQIASGQASYNLDPWAMDLAELRHLATASAGDIVVVEAMMGLFDGAADGSGSAADLAACLELPIILVLDCSKQSHSIAALIKGFSEFRQDVEIAGVILNKVGSPRHERMLREAILPLTVPVFGAIHRSDHLVLSERHLGLVQAEEIENINGFMDVAANEIAAKCDLDLILSKGTELTEHISERAALPVPGQKIAIARDLAFSFIYPHHLHSWKNSGAEITFFSPLADEAPYHECDAVYLPGGYPELHGAQLASAPTFKESMRKSAGKGTLIYGECGGYMVLGEGLIDKDGNHHEMLGLLDLETSFEKRKLSLGYRRAIAKNFVLGAELKCHEFHYSTIVHERGDPLFSIEDARGETPGTAGLRRGNVMGSYLHVITGGQ